MIEFEMKIPASHDQVTSELMRIEAERVKSEYNHDVYFNHPSRDFAETDEALRVRTTPNHTKITYKGPKFDNQSKSREEIDLNIENDQMIELLEKLSFTKSGEVRKQRETWKYEEFTITLDDVSGLGEFVEVEIIGTDQDDRNTIVMRLKELLGKLGLDPKAQIVKSYLELILEKKN